MPLAERSALTLGAAAAAGTCFDPADACSTIASRAGFALTVTTRRERRESGQRRRQGVVAGGQALKREFPPRVRQDPPRRAPLATIRTATPAIAAPRGSFTLPVNVPAAVCAAEYTDEDRTDTPPLQAQSYAFQTPWA